MYYNSVSNNESFFFIWALDYADRHNNHYGCHYSIHSQSDSFNLLELLECFEHLGSRLVLRINLHFDLFEGIENFEEKNCEYRAVQVIIDESLNVSMITHT